jgi:hypothetical protein
MSFLDQAIDDYLTTREAVTNAPQAAELVGTFTDVVTERLNGQAVGLMAYEDPIASDPDDTITPPGAVGAAPALYDQPYSAAQTAAINALAANVAALAAELHDLKLKMRVAGHLLP